MASAKRAKLPSVTQPTTTFTVPPSFIAPKLAPLASTPFSITVNGGTFMVVGGTVLLTFTVKKGDTLAEVSAWFKLLGGSTALKEWSHSTMDNPQLIIPGEVLTVTVPAKDIPKSSPVRLMDPS
jgi:archaellum component FlaF (FlaF/FlaG flagellin family)